MEDLVQALAKFEQSLRSEMKAGFDEVRGRFDDVFGHFDAIYHRFDKLETENRMPVVGVKRIEERLDGMQDQVRTLEARLDD